MSEKKELSRSASVVARSMFEAMKMMKKNEGSISFSEIQEKLPNIIVYNEWERADTSEKTRQPRWLVNTLFYSVEYVKAGLIEKDSGIWYLTDKGDKALQLTAEKVFEIAHTEYRQYKKQNNKHEEIDEDIEEVRELTPDMVIKEAEGVAQEGIVKKIRSLDAYEFQKLCASLLRSMGYYTPFIAPKGKDGGIDIVAYENAAGVGNRVIAQVKHTPTTSTDVTIIRNLAALLRKDGDTGIVFTSGTFTNDAIRFARETKSNIRLINQSELIKLWIDNYSRLSEEDRDLLPLKPVYYISR